MAETLTWKAIKPQRMKDKALQMRLINGMKAIGKEIQRDFEGTTRTWTHKPKFVTAMSFKGQGPALLVGTDDPIYNMVNNGVAPHIIRPVRAKVLRFQLGYRAKSAPGSLEAGSGGANGPVIYTRIVHHPGIKARHFDQVIQRTWQPRFKVKMEDAMRKAAKDSGHAI